MSRSEKSIVDAIRISFAKAGIQSLKVHGTVYAVKGELDVIGCYNGLFVGVEVKTATGVASPAQYRRLKFWRKTGARVGIASSVKEAWLIVKNNPTCTCCYCGRPTYLSEGPILGLQLEHITTFCRTCHEYTVYKEDNLFSLRGYTHYVF